MRLIVTTCAVLAGFSVLSTSGFAQQKTVRACQDEWRLNRAANQAAGITEKAYVDKCRTAGTSLQPAAAAPAAPPAAKPPAPTAAAPAPKTAPAATVGLGSAEFKTEAQAKARCPRDTVVWANLDSKIYHFSGNRDYGNTKEGAYMCEKDAMAQGVRAAKNEKRP
jgi:hypothetical protein